MLMKPIRTDADARAFLVDTGRADLLATLIDDPKLGPVFRFDASCHRCDGSGYLWWTNVDGGRCYGCGGVKTKGRTRTVTLKRHAQKLKSKDTAKARKAAKVAEAKAAAKAAGEAFIASHPGLSDALKVDHKITRDVADRILKWGSVSDKTVALVFKVAADEANKADRVEAPAGRIEITGKVLSVKISEGNYGVTYRMTLLVATDGGEWLANGTVPRALWSKSVDAPFDLKGKSVSLTATIEPKEAGFAFFKRPTKATAA